MSEASQPDDLTLLLRQMGKGDAEARERLAPAVYDDLIRIARWRRRREPGNPTLSTTELVHEFFLRQLDGGGDEWRDRGHFFAYASKAIRNLLVDHARRRRTEKAGGGRVLSLDGLEREPGAGEAATSEEQLLDLDRALTELEARSPRLARVVECRFFGGMTVAETAEALEVGRRTVERDWTRARAYLLTSLDPDAPPQEEES